jgi:hypothetical protein
MALLVLALVLTAHAYLKRYPRNSFRRHLTQPFHDLDETAATLTAWLMNARRSAHDFTSQCPLFVDHAHDHHAYDDDDNDDDNEDGDALAENTAVKGGKHNNNKNHHNKKQPRGHHHHPVASTKMKRY